MARVRRRQLQRCTTLPPLFLPAFPRDITSPAAQPAKQVGITQPAGSVEEQTRVPSAAGSDAKERPRHVPALARAPVHPRDTKSGGLTLVPVMQLFPMEIQIGPSSRLWDFL